MADHLTLPSQHELLRELSRVEEHLLKTEVPSEAGALLSRRDCIVRLITLSVYAGKERNLAAVQFVEADANAQQILKELRDGVQLPSGWSSHGPNEVDVAAGGILSRAKRPT